MWTSKADHWKWVTFLLDTLRTVQQAQDFPKLGVKTKVRSRPEVEGQKF